MAPPVLPTSVMAQSLSPVAFPSGQAANQGPLRVVVTDFDIRFLSLVWLMVKVVLAAIPAAFIVAGIWLATSMAALLLVRLVAQP